MAWVESDAMRFVRLDRTAKTVISLWPLCRSAYAPVGICRGALCDRRQRRPLHRRSKIRARAGPPRRRELRLGRSRQSNDRLLSGTAPGVCGRLLRSPSLLGRTRANPNRRCGLPVIAPRPALVDPIWSFSFLQSGPWSGGDESARSVTHVWTALQYVALIVR